MTGPEPPGDHQTLIVGISGPSSSGKTTLARLLQRVFCGVRLDGSSDADADAQARARARSIQGEDEGASREDGQSECGRLNTFIIHEDDFYFPDDQYVSFTLSCLCCACLSLPPPHFYFTLIPLHIPIPTLPPPHEPNPYSNTIHRPQSTIHTNKPPTESHTQRPPPAPASKTGTPPPQSTSPSSRSRSPTSENTAGSRPGCGVKRIRMRWRTRAFRMGL
jgi:hypothetical protein